MPPGLDLGALAAGPGGRRRGAVGQRSVPRQEHPGDAVSCIRRPPAQRDVLGRVFAAFNKGVQQASARFCLPTGAKRLVTPSLCEGVAPLPAWVAACFMGLDYPAFVIFYKPDKLPSPVSEAQDRCCTSMAFVIRQNDLGGEYSAAACCFPEQSSHSAEVCVGKTGINSAASVYGN